MNIWLRGLPQWELFIRAEISRFYWKNMAHSFLKSCKTNKPLWIADDVKCLRTCPSKRHAHKYTQQTKKKHFWWIHKKMQTAEILHLYPMYSVGEHNNRSERRLNVDWSGERETCCQRGEPHRPGLIFFFLSPPAESFSLWKTFLFVQCCPISVMVTRCVVVHFFFQSEILWKGFLFTKE